MFILDLTPRPIPQSLRLPLIAAGFQSRAQAAIDRAGRERSSWDTFTAREFDFSLPGYITGSDGGFAIRDQYRQRFINELPARWRGIVPQSLAANAFGILTDPDTTMEQRMRLGRLFPQQGTEAMLTCLRRGDFPDIDGETRARLITRLEGGLTDALGRQDRLEADFMADATRRSRRLMERAEAWREWQEDIDQRISGDTRWYTAMARLQPAYQGQAYGPRNMPYYTQLRGHRPMARR